MGTRGALVGEEPTTVEGWARTLLGAGDAAEALALDGPPAQAEAASEPVDPGRPARLRTGDLGPRSRRSVRREGLDRPRARASLLARFAHHELQAAELMAWAVLRFPRTPAAFRLGLGRIAAEELDHARRLEGRVRALGYEPDQFARRDWFWERVPSCTEPAAFCALMGLGLEAANLEHAELWAERLASAGDPVSAEVQRTIGREEIAHVRFARTWFERFAGPLEFERWRAQLPEPITPSLLRGRRLARAARREAGFDGPFLDALEAWPPAR